MRLKKVNKRELFLGIPIFIIYMFSLYFLFILKNMSLSLDIIIFPIIFKTIFLLETIMIYVPIYWTYVYFKNKKTIRKTKNISKQTLIDHISGEEDLEEYLENESIDKLREIKDFYLNEGE